MVLGPDVFVNASVAPGSAPDRVVQRALSRATVKVHATGWLLERVEAMLRALPEFRDEAVAAQMKLIVGYLEVIEDPTEHPAEAWEPALSAAAKSAGATRVVTDHPDLLASDSSEVEFISTEAWLLEQALPPPPPSVPSE